MRKTKTHVTRPSKRSRQRRRADIEETDEGERFTYQKTFTLKEDDEVTASG